MKEFKDLDWISIQQSETSYGKYTEVFCKNKLLRSDIVLFIEEIIKKWAQYFSMSYESFAEEFYDFNPNLLKDIENLFKKKTGWFKGRLRLDSDDADLWQILNSILVPDIDRVKNACDAFCAITFKERVQFWGLLDATYDSKESVTAEAFRVYKMYSSLSIDEKVLFNVSIASAIETGYFKKCRVNPDYK